MVFDTLEQVYTYTVNYNLSFQSRTLWYQIEDTTGKMCTGNDIRVIFSKCFGTSVVCNLNRSQPIPVFCCGPCGARHRFQFVSQTILPDSTRSKQTNKSRAESDYRFKQKGLGGKLDSAPDQPTNLPLASHNRIVHFLQLCRYHKQENPSSVSIRNKS